MSEERTQPDWVYKDKRPEADREYFENLARCIFQAGLSWQLMTKKWPNFQRAFENFDIAKVAAYGAEDIRRLSEDASIIRNRQKILSIIHNAREFERIARENGSFQAWLDSMDKSNNYDRVVKSLRSRFKRVGPGTAHIFLWSVGEKIEYDPTVHTRQPTKIV
ncbi:MAG: DNA-3-methyladenine glycosylase I [Candidatus Bathyarchaeota archaeon]|nr:MAG: DNA-3-methyladenine glycosylase I [Candidatus Bathyarchaeota archaeon]